MAKSVNYKAKGVGKMVVIVLEFPTTGKKPVHLRRARNVELTYDFKAWLAEELILPVKDIGLMAGDRNVVEFFWSNDLNADIVNMVLNSVASRPSLKKATIRFQDKSSIVM